MSDSCDKCNRDAEWTWHDGMWSGGRYCDEHIREKLDKRRRFGDHRDEITTSENVTTLGDSGTVVIPAGARPLDGAYPVVRTKEALDEHRQVAHDGNNT